MIAFNNSFYCTVTVRPSATASSLLTLVLCFATPVDHHRTTRPSFQYFNIIKFVVGCLMATTVAAALVVPFVTLRHTQCARLLSSPHNRLATHFVQGSSSRKVFAFAFRTLLFIRRTLGSHVQCPSLTC
ncbi:unnamed protein product [Ceratitis capitata]|uniref:(Mediterranean fruit fly) hypothetical protein n=1 Tax=Ceratitis capitata TaxID=7213 RepID=A0A811TWB1_CERCA|nr:unnamed protein product [Ceratitis capitata]